MLQTFDIATRTPYYIYDTELFARTIQTAKAEAACLPTAQIHFAVKSNSNIQLLYIAANEGLGADCVSGAEIEHCIACGIPAEKIVFAGVGKSDEEINIALDTGIGCFNVESVPELDVINELAAAKGKVAPISFRINPNVDAHTHANITTGLEENKFGIAMSDMVAVINHAKQLNNVHYLGLHFHIGSQILDMTCFRLLSQRINELQDQLEIAGINDTTSINVGGGLGIDYTNPELNPIPNFRDYFRVFADNLCLRPSQALHFELGRALSAQCGRLITKCLYVKTTATKQFAIVDAGMSDLLRPALYDAHHKIINLTGRKEQRPLHTYDVVGPICESSDVFDKNITLHEVRRGDMLAILSAGAYGFVMASQYNLRTLPQEVIT
ncbi:MAG: diaminopimelate decarboxylase [Prevotellaceae bacterium]|nr:diaminopimelate decarboxylase [Prevotellaceae bacterium]